MKLKDMLRNSIVIFIFFLQVSVSIKAQTSDPTGVFNLGNKQYEEHNYEAAINSYKRLCAEYYSPELFLNLGNSYYKLNDIPNTIFHYEKALKLSPGNLNILHNLKLANKRVSDKNTVNESIRLNDWFFTWFNNGSWFRQRFSIMCNHTPAWHEYFYRCAECYKVFASRNHK